MLLVQASAEIKVTKQVWVSISEGIYKDNVMIRIFYQEKKAKSIMKTKRCEDKQIFKPPQRVTKVETLKPSIIEEFSKVDELPQATIEVEETIVLHVKEEISNVEHCDLMRDKNIEKEKIEIKEKKRVENKKRLVERSCIF
ncbi:hypothetical protein M9H77_08704 [Catharanthus roseus]|uniref:Uncharacterized protein n=1 Tax=Catharanthus roseus TaxID=4058 RepID=A0ACC0BYR1_CATRO|nr:hypothetical protein M9H77_08704 [Catharanthus roseus]